MNRANLVRTESPDLWFDERCLPITNLLILENTTIILTFHSYP